MTPSSSIEQFKLLVRTFFDDFVSPEPEDGDDGDRTPLLPYVLGTLIGPGIFFCCYELPRYADVRLKLPLIAQQQPTIEGKFFLITFTVVAVGFFMAWRWDSLFVQEREYLILASLPVRPRVIFAAKFAALLLAVAVIVGCVNAVSFVAYPAIATVGGVSAGTSYVAHVLTVLAAAAFTFAFFMGLQLLLLTFVSYEWTRRLAPVVQLLSSGALAFMFLMAIDSSAVVAQVRRTDLPVLRWLPPYWFTGLYQQLLGRGDSFWLQMAQHAEYALALLVGVCAVMVPVAYLRHIKQVLEAKPDNTAAKSPISIIVRVVSGWITRAPEQRAGCEFVLLTLARSHRHRLVLSAVTALALAFAVQGGVVTVAGLARDNPLIVVLSAPLILAFFLFVGVLWAMTMPTGGRARWVFEIAAEGRRAMVVAGARRAFLVVGAALPIALAVALFAWRFDLRQVITFLPTTVLLVCSAAACTSRLIKAVPFARRQQRFSPPKLTLVIFAIWFAFTMYSYAMARLELAVSNSPLGMVVLSAVLLVGTVAALRWPVLYEDPIPDWWRREEGLLLVEIEP